MADDVQGPASPTARRRWLAGVAAAWAVAVAVAAYLSAGRDEPTAREQTSVTQARPAVDRAVTGLVSAAGPDAVVLVSPFRRVGECRISAARDGERWEQAVAFYTRSGGEGTLLDRLVRGLPAGYGARVRHGTGGRHTLRADAGDFVGVSGGSAAPGEIRLYVSTGCRTGTANPSPVRPDQAARAPVEAALAALGVRSARWIAHDLPCSGGGALRVVTAEGEPDAGPGPLPSSLMPVGPNAVVSQAELYAYRTGTASVVARVRDGHLVVTATTPCA